MIDQKLISANKIDLISKRLSYILRHNPKRFKVYLDEKGWANLDDVLGGLRSFGDIIDLEKEDLLNMVSKQRKTRFDIYNNKIKANYGHTVFIKEMDVVKPPDVLYHGTARRYLNSILRNGLIRMQRQYVHLSVNLDIAIETGKRKDSTPSIIQIDSKTAYQEGILFYKGSDRILLSENLLPKYLKIIKIDKIQT
ncbi:MAG: RNA 2'-phosphotransferase [Candidatus Nitrosocosmicus sp.]